jgi:hypothetical protein
MNDDVHNSKPFIFSTFSDKALSLESSLCPTYNKQLRLIENLDAKAYMV